MTPEQKEKVDALRRRFANKRTAAFEHHRFAAEEVQRAQRRFDAIYEEWLALDKLVTASDATLLAIAGECR